MRIALRYGIAVAAFGLAALGCVPASAGDLEGVTMPDTASLGGQTLVLNGMGLRKKLFFKVYVAGLYVATRGSDANALLDQAGPKRVAYVLKREVDADTFAKAFEDGLRERATPEQFDALKERVARLKDQILSLKQVQEGAQVSLDFVPGVGTTILHGGKPIGAAIEGDDFFKAVLGIYLGPKPIQDTLKAGLLGGK